MRRHGQLATIKAPKAYTAFKNAPRKYPQDDPAPKASMQKTPRSNIGARGILRGTTLILFRLAAKNSTGDHHHLYL